MMQFIGITLGLFVALLLALEFGRWLRRRREKTESSVMDSAGGEGVVFAVLGLMIAFTFNTSASRFDDRRRLIVDQANAVGTAWLRVDLLPESDREPIRKGIRDWVKLELDVVPKSGGQDSPEFNAAVAKAQQLQNQTWAAAIDAVGRNPRPQYASLVLSPINDWMDLTSTRLEMNNRNLPPLVMPTLIFISMIGAVLTGFGMGKSKSRSQLHVLSFAAAIAFSLYVIMDLSKPRLGLIRVDAADDAMRQVYASIAIDSPVPATQSVNP
jgi:hypothetical protein